jgi:chemotaxis protein methyltransferase CheR
MLTIAKEAIYEEEKLQEIPPQLIKKYFTSVRGATVPSYRANESIRSLIQLAKLNLMEEWPMRGPFDVIFCRNVMIYFDRPTREKLINRFWGLLKPGGYLLVGHSESLTSFPHQFRYVQPAVYIK